MKCTWYYREHDGGSTCGHEAVSLQQDRNGRMWANLCIKHEKELADSIGQDAKEILRCWIRASGGAKKMAHNM